MNAQPRSALLVAVVLLLAIGIFGSRLVCDPSGLRDLIDADRTRAQLQQFERGKIRHLESKNQVVRELIAQRCSLSEALARLQELDREWLQESEREGPDFAKGILQAYRWAGSDAEYHYRFITWRIADFLSDQPEEAAAVLRRLEMDYQQFQAKSNHENTKGRKHEKDKKRDQKKCARLLILPFSLSLFRALVLSCFRDSI